MFNKFKDWKGTRKNLIDEITNFEKKYPKKFKMISKKSGLFLGVNIRRIQQFIDVSIMPKALINSKKYEYTSEHLFRYLAAIYLKNNGSTIKQIEKILSTLELEEIEKQILINDNKEDKLSNILFNEKEKINLSSELKNLGREEGRVLRSQWIKFAVTKWCNLEIRKNKLEKISEEELNVILLAIENSLRDTLALVNKGDLENKIS